MNNIAGWNDKYIDEPNDQIIILADADGKLVAFENTISSLYELKQKEKELELSEEFDEIVFARNGEAISFEEASKYFPKLITQEFWKSQSFTGYNEMSVEDILKQL